MDRAAAVGPQVVLSEGVGHYPNYVHKRSPLISPSAAPGLFGQFSSDRYCTLADALDLTPDVTETGS